jgi:hypothetical protein
VSDPSSVPPSKAPGKKAAIAVVGVVAGVALLVTVGAMVPRLRAQQESNRHSLCLNNLHNIGLALTMYHERYGVFPPAHIADADGKPMHSWRVLILPFLEQQDLYDRYNFDEPWNGPNNRKLADSDLWVYRCPSSKQLQNTSFLAVVDEATVWPGVTGRKTIHLRDGTSNTILLVESVESGIHWMEPRDLTLDDALKGINADTKRPHIATKHATGASVLWCDCHITTLPIDMTPDELKARLTASGGEDIPDPN